MREDTRNRECTHSAPPSSISLAALSRQSKPIESAWVRQVCLCRLMSLLLNSLHRKHPGGGRDQNERSYDNRDQALPVPPHLQRRPPLRQHLPPRRTLLLLPPRHPKTRPTPEPRPKIQLRPPTPRRPLRHPGLHRNHPPEDRLERPGLQKSRPTPLRPTDRQPEPAQTAATRRRRRTDPRNHHRPRTRHPRPTNRDPRKEKLHRPTARRIPPKTRSPTTDPGHRRPNRQHYLGGIVPVCSFTNSG